MKRLGSALEAGQEGTPPGGQEEAGGESAMGRGLWVVWGGGALIQGFVVEWMLSESGDSYNEKLYTKFHFFIT